MDNERREEEGWRELDSVRQRYEEGVGTREGLLPSAILAAASLIWPSKMPDHLLVKLWTAVKDMILSEICCRYTEDSIDKDLLFAYTQTLLQAVRLFLSQCPGLPYGVFWDECAEALVASINNSFEIFVQHLACLGPFLQGLLQLMTEDSVCTNIFFFLRFQEVTLLRLWFVLRLSSQETTSMPVIPGFDPFKSASLVQVGFQAIVDLFQVSNLDMNIEHLEHNAWEILRELRQVNEEEWEASLAAVLHHFMAGFRKSGVNVLEKKPLRFLFNLLTRPSFAKAFLDSLLLCLEATNGQNRSAVSCAFQIFEHAYRKHPIVIITCCLEKLVDGHSDNVHLRLECLALAGKTNKKCTVDGHTISQFVWPPGPLEDLMSCILYDTSVRVRRLALQILVEMHLNGISENDFVELLVLKSQDVDEKVRIIAFQRLLKIPFQLLANNLTKRDWQFIFNHFLNSPNKDLCNDAEGLFVSYLTSDVMSHPPSVRLKEINFMKSSNSHRYHEIVAKHTDGIFDKELAHLDLQASFEFKPD